MAYVPPHLRNRQSAGLKTGAGQRSLDNLQKRTTASSDPTYNLDDISSLIGCDKNDLSTLTTSKALSSEETSDPQLARTLEDDVLRAIVLYEGQHPEWKNGHKILCKSNLQALHKLVRDQSDRSEEETLHALTVTDPTQEYPLFQEIPFMKKKFDFAGWWRIQDVKFLPPRSTELVALFEKKFKAREGRGQNHAFAFQRGKPKARTEEAWHDSLNREWAVVSLVRNDARKELPKPQKRPIVIHDDPPEEPPNDDLNKMDGTIGSPDN